jgi:membrane associated rhomboid family serine protease
VSNYGEVENHCYRHPNRESFVRCQRCGRTICAECQTQAAVGVHCPECVREARASAPRGARPTTRAARWLSPTGGRPVVTYSLIALCLVIYGIQYLSGQALTGAWQYAGAYTSTQPWRMITSIFIHYSIIHVLSNMFSLYLIGPALESVLGRARYVALFLIAGFGGSVGVLLFSDPLVASAGASGAILGMLGAILIFRRQLSFSLPLLIVVIVINLGSGAVVSNISWQAHIGGFVVGAAVAFVFWVTRQRSRRVLRFALTAAIVLVLVIITAVAAVFV